MMAVFFILFCVLALGACEDLTRDSIFRISPTSDIELSIVKGLKSKNVVFWFEPNLHVPTEAVIPTSSKDEVISILERGNIEFSEVEKTLGRAVLKENYLNKKEKLKSTRQHTFSRPTLDYILSYYATYGEIVLWLRKMQRRWWNIATIVNIGKTREGRDMIVFKLGLKSAKPKPIIFIDAGIHSREWLAPATALYLIHKLTEGYWTGKSRYLLEMYDWYILPVENPDGYEMTFKGGESRMWRKNKRPVNPDLLEEGDDDCFFHGVDLNRNWDYRWNETNPGQCFDDYGGPAAFSEPETQNVRDIMLKLLKNGRLKAVVSMHAYSELWMIPWSSELTHPADRADLMQVSLAATNAIFESSGHHWKAGSPPEIIYPASGTKMDWLKANGVKYAFGLELRPSRNFMGSGFLISPDHIKPSGEEIFAAVNAMVLEMRKISLSRGNA
ncbi:carboxypeptidase B-like [Tubulanus polymorphus]|uniref:carboxypeptidase B-like n=1 Tax=Tubulanus polymorphus TaxID=672921 RepID=UPI003DA64873